MSTDSATHAAPVIEDETSAERRHAPRYRVLIHNDDVTPMDFVVDLLRRVFHKNQTDAARIMLEAHTKDIALVAVLTLEQAEFRVDQAMSLARARKFPTKLTHEPEE